MKWTSKGDLETLAASQGYRPEILEKVHRLLDLTQELMSIDFLKSRLALKGGTAINLFCSDTLPRLSVDLDFNYIGAVKRETMKSERIKIEKLISDICKKKQYRVERNPRAYAGGKMILVYDSIFNHAGRLEIDLNYLYRSPLWKTEWKYSPHGPERIGVTTLNIHELAAGKLHALLSRTTARDLFDSHQILKQWPLDKTLLRHAFTVYAGMRKNHWSEMGTDLVQWNIKDIRNKLIPVLQHTLIPGTHFQEIKTWSEALVEECKVALGNVLPFNKNERAFLTALDAGKIQPELISRDPDFCQAVTSHPALHWKLAAR